MRRSNEDSALEHMRARNLPMTREVYLDRAPAKTAPLTTLLFWVGLPKLRRKIRFTLGVELYYGS
jgi:hypothetical protein